MIKLPTLVEIQTDIENAIESAFNIKIPKTGKNFFRVLSVVLAGVLKIFYLVIANLQKNIFPDTADPESKGGTLERFGRVKLGRNPFGAVAGKYEIVVTGTIGAVIKAQTTFKSNEGTLNPGKLYILDEAFTLVTGNDLITVRALVAGVDGKLDDLDTLSATSPIDSVDSLATVDNEVVEPRAAEDIEAYRKAITTSFRLETQGGSPGDYRIWAQDAQGVAKVYAYANSGFPNQVNLFVEATKADSIDGKGTPSPALLSSVEDVVDFSPDITLSNNERSRRPAQVVVNYAPITPRDIDIEIVGFSAITVPIQTLISGALEELVDTIRPFVAGVDILDEKNDILDVNKIIAAIISQKPGAIFASIVLKVDGVTLLTFTFEDGDIPYLNSVTYV
jgi:hypothetical protein